MPNINTDYFEAFKLSMKHIKHLYVAKYFETNVDI